MKSCFVRVELITSDDGLAELHFAWTDLYRSAGISNVFLTFDWVATLWQHCRGDDRLAVVVRDGPRLVAVAPLAIVRAAGLRILGFVGRGLSNYEDVLVAPEQRDDALRAIVESLRESGGWDVFRLNKMATDSPDFAFFRDSTLGRDMRGFVCADDIAPYIPLSGTWEWYWEQLGEFRRNSRWRARRLESDLGPFRFVRPGCEDEAMRLLGTLVALHRARRSRLDGNNVLELPWARDFYRDIALLAFRSGQLDLVAMRVGNETAAVSMGLVQGEKYFGLLTAFDERFRKYSPGRLLMFHLVESAYRRRLKEFDFGIGGSPYKLQFRPSVRKLGSVFLCRQGVRGRFCQAWFGTVRPILRDQRLLVDAARWVNRGARRAGRALRPDT